MPVIGDGEWDKRDKLAFEREMLGLYVSDHPLFGLEHVLGAAADTTIAALSEEGTVPDGAVVTLAGILSGVQRRVTKQGRAWASATLEDLAGGVETLFFPNTYEVIGQYIAEDAIVVVKGRVDRRDDTPRHHGDGHVHAGRDEQRRRTSRSRSPSRCTGAPRRSWNGSRRPWCCTPATPRCTSSCSTAAQTTTLRLGPFRVRRDHRADGRPEERPRPGQRELTVRPGR